MNMKNPLNAQDKSQLQQLQRRIADLKVEMAKAQSCGVNCDDLTPHVEYQQQAVDNMLATYFPHDAMPPQS